MNPDTGRNQLQNEGVQLKMPQGTSERKRRITGVVIAIHSQKFTIRSDRDYTMALPGRFKKGPRQLTTPFVVGDRLELILDENVPTLSKLFDRKNEISRVGSLRPPIKQIIAANVDAVICVVSVAEPPFNSRLLDRLLLFSEVAGVTGSICVNKWDLVGAADASPLIPHEPLGYRVIRTSALLGDGIEELRSVLRNRISLLVGPSGVGKSTLLNRLVPEAGLRTLPISPSTGRGVHTTTRVDWLDLPTGGVVLDTPGLRHIRPWGLEPLNLAHYFPEFRDLIRDCQFRDCRHRSEPGCAVIRAIRSGIPELAGRYDSYCRIFASLERDELW
ncbi:MAG: ribosome small subunit-dependent GTPase A [Candidatus Eisenbacteria bacterium]|uniref:Small ribosomal subunit biogenesis GTPase RsgA n=1 Tax=Eiseniibacteriota bacterium TaxID=2212470 RepID=A0A948WE81_UNCEI|nr:ribosome small subunit-dependent GTPase A [Candidatus Eisenbacteria bacterium]